MTLWNDSRRAVCMTLLGATALSGCSVTPTGPIASYSDNARQVSQQIDGLISDYNASARNEVLANLTTSPNKVTKQSLQTAAQAGLDNLDGNALYQANQALLTYSQALYQLSTTASNQEMASAGVKLADALSDLDHAYQKWGKASVISDEQAARSSRIISETFAVYTDRQRAKAIRDLVMAADPLVQSLSRHVAEQILRQDFSQRLEVAKNIELSLYLTAVNNTSRQDLLLRRQAVEQSYQRYSAMLASLAAVESSARALHEMASAHHVIASEVQAGRFDSSRIIDAVQHLKRTHKLFSSVEDMVNTCLSQVIIDQNGARCPE
ncbi:hypothetical protein K7V76_003547 [Vibrio fluvialis]|nr:hypothetical protein [Vibrio fluvialis]EKO3523666.1 hypothetical protein [Vibrio fluvialis]EKO3524707.1 hypothetical protein [Vibrio fluvialis]EKO3546067.1 hypothetical protein [Vibrio fluvialis]ELP3315415.1 hypothetical protein [Vibrio fluvialis]